MSASYHLPIEICPFEPRTGIGADVGALPVKLREDLLDCTGSGDAEPACQFVLDTWSPRFTTYDRALKEFRTAKPSEIQATCEAIYHDHEKGEFADMRKAALYLIWDVAHGLQDELDREAV